MFLALCPELDWYFIPDINEHCIYPWFSVICYLWLTPDCWVMSYQQWRCAINALLLTLYFALAPSVPSLYFLGALSSFGVSHKLLAWDRCSSRGWLLLPSSPLPAAPRTTPLSRQHPGLCRSCRYPQPSAGTAQTAAPALASPCHPARLQIRSLSCHYTCHSRPSYSMSLPKVRLLL